MVVKRLLNKYGVFVILSAFIVAFIATIPAIGYCDLVFNPGFHFELIAPTINITPNPAYVGQDITITARNFYTIPYGSDTYPIAFCNAYVDEHGIMQPIIIQSDGTFTVKPTVKAAGMDGIHAWDKWGNQSNVVNLTVYDPTPVPTVTATPLPTNTPAATPSGESTPIPADAIAPLTALNLTGIKDSNGVFTPPVVCTLTALDGPSGSGVKVIQYSFDGSAWNNYTGPFTVTQAGNSTLFYKATDNAGNTEVAQVTSIVIGGTSTPAPSTKTPAPTSLVTIGSMAFIGVILALARKGKHT